MKTIIKISFILLLIINQVALSQEFTATVNRNPVSVGERFELQFTINTDASNFRAPDLKDFRVLGGPNQSQSMSIVNGQMSRSITYSYVLMAQKEGEFIINPASITAAGKQLRTEPIRIRVLPESEAQKEQRRQETEQQRSMEEQANNVIKDNLYIKLNVSKRDVYQGEEIIATYKLFRHPELNVLSLNPTKNPSLNGFWSQDLEGGELKWEREVVNGVMFNTAIIKRVVLVPQQTGKLELDPFEFDARVRLTVGGQGFFRNYRDFEYTLRSDRSTINVKPLPTPTPLDFTGGVGNIQTEAFFDRTDGKAGEPLMLKVRISGQGNLRLVTPPIINFPPGFEVFDPKTIDNTRITASGTQGNKTFEYLIIPRNAGTFEISPLSISYFDLANKNYKTNTTDKFVLNIDKSDGKPSETFISGIRKEDIQLLGKDIRFIKTSSNLKQTNYTMFGSIEFIATSIIPVLAFFAFLFYRKKQEKLNSNIALLKNKKATKIAKKRLETAKKLLDKGDLPHFYEEISKALWDYASDKFSISKAELTKDKVQEILISKINDHAVAEAFTDIIDNCEFARYAPKASGVEPKMIYTESMGIITLIEDKLK